MRLNSHPTFIRLHGVFGGNIDYLSNRSGSRGNIASALLEWRSFWVSASICSHDFRGTLAKILSLFNLSLLLLIIGVMLPTSSHRIGNTLIIVAIGLGIADYVLERR